MRLPFWVRRCLAPLTYLPDPGYRGCQRCRCSWQSVRPHRVPVETKTYSGGIFALCEQCWRETGVEERLRMHRTVHQAWAAAGHHICSPAVLREVVLAESATNVPQ